MALTNAFYEAVKHENILRIRIMMKDSLLVDPSFKEFGEMEAAAAKVPGLYELHDGKPFRTEQAAWDDEYMNREMVQLINNFSRERIRHLKDVVRVLRPVRDAEKTANCSPRTHTPDSARRQSRSDQQSGTTDGAAVVGAALVGAAAGGVIAEVAGITVIGCSVAGAVIGGVAAWFAVHGGDQR